MYVERSCYYPVRNAATIRSCLKQQRVVFLGDSTTRGLVYEAMVMWSDTKPYKNYENKSDVCMYRERMMPVRGGKRLVGTWESSQCSSKGDVAVADVTFGGHSMIHSPEWSYLRQPRCMGMGNLADRQAGEKFAKQLKPFNIAVIHSCDHDLCNRFNAKPKMLEQYRLNLRRLAKLLRKHAKGKRIIWLSCAAQGNLGKNAYYTQTQLGRCLDYVAFPVAHTYSKSRFRQLIPNSVVTQAYSQVADGQIGARGVPLLSSPRLSRSAGFPLVLLYGPFEGVVVGVCPVRGCARNLLYQEDAGGLGKGLSACKLCGPTC